MDFVFVKYRYSRNNVHFKIIAKFATVTTIAVNVLETIEHIAIVRIDNTFQNDATARAYLP
jgi:hypothetical protein